VEYFWIKGAVALVVGVAALAKAIRAVEQRAGARQRMRSGQRTIADRAVVTLRGTVRVFAEPLIAPLSGTPCVLHRSAARVYTTGRGLGRVYRVVDGEYVSVEMAEFILDTREGPVIVSGTEAEVTMRPGAIVPRQLAREAAFLRSAGDGSDPRTAAFDEVVIQPGAKIEVHGVAQIEVDDAANGERGYRDAPTKTRIVGDAAHPLTIASA
jgi:hypothetical protein